MAKRHMYRSCEHKEGGPTRLNLLHEAGTLPVKKFDDKPAYSNLDKEPQDDGKEPCSLLASSVKYLNCNQKLLLLVKHSTTYTIQSATTQKLHNSAALDMYK